MYTQQYIQVMLTAGEQAVSITCMTYTYYCVYTILDSWWWTQKLSETRRVLSQKQIWEISASHWFCYKNKVSGYLGMLQWITVVYPKRHKSITFWDMAPFYRWTGIAQSVYRLATGWTVRGWNPGGGGQIFRTCPDRSWGPPSLLYNGYRVFPGDEATGTWRWTPTPSSAEIKERVELYLYSPSAPTWQVIRWTLHLPS